MKTEKILKPGQPGTKKLVEKYGDDLVCIRYRYDEKTNCKVKTAEIIVSKKPVKKKRTKVPPDRMMFVKINFNDQYSRKLIMAAGGKWNSMKKLWELPYYKIIDLGLENNIV